MATPATTVRERILWEYAKLIGRSALKPDENRWGFVNATYRRLVASDIHPSELTRDNQKLVRQVNACAYCGAPEDLQWEHIVPRSRGGPDTIDNQVLACGSCNRAKGVTDLLAWRTSDEVPTLVLSKYLKLLLTAHEQAGTLDWPSYPSGEPLSLRALHLIFLP